MISEGDLTPRKNMLSVVKIVRYTFTKNIFYQVYIGLSIF